MLDTAITLYNHVLSSFRELSGATRMQAIGHQVVGSKDKSHEDVKLMFEKFFGGQAANVKRKLKKELGSTTTKHVLTRIFQVC